MAQRCDTESQNRTEIAWKSVHGVETCTREGNEPRHDLINKSNNAE